MKPLLSVRLRATRQIRTRLKEVLKVRCREDEHFTRAIAAKEIIALAWPSHLDPACEVFFSCFGSE